MASFEKVSFEEYLRTWKDLYKEDNVNEDLLRVIYDNIKIPSRSTDGSCGYDFYSPFGFTLRKDEDIVIPSGIKMHCESNEFLALFPRSGMGFKHRVMLANTSGIIDSDYDLSDNEGHIMVKFFYAGFENSVLVDSKINHTDGDKITLVTRIKNDHSPCWINVDQGDKFVQGIFLEYKKCENEDTSNMKIRKGGIGSTGK